uniref:Uncharacterized protein n=1 Tax=Anguilla anguilla TaxID=7936 RepID=A0A0E9PYU7_ANGAN
MTFTGSAQTCLTDWTKQSTLVSLEPGPSPSWSRITGMIVSQSTEKVKLPQLAQVRQQDNLANESQAAG